MDRQRRQQQQEMKGKSWFGPSKVFHLCTLGSLVLLLLCSSESHGHTLPYRATLPLLGLVLLSDLPAIPLPGSILSHPRLTSLPSLPSLRSRNLLCFSVLACVTASSVLPDDSVLHAWAPRLSLLAVPLSQGSWLPTIYALLLSALSAPLSSPVFLDVLFTDILTSMSLPAQDLLRSLYAAFPVLPKVAEPYLMLGCVVTPLWCRYLQNLRLIYDRRQRLPYIANCLKYLMSCIMSVWSLASLQNSYTAFTFFMCVATSTYQAYWDVFEDWSLLTLHPRTAARDRKFPSSPPPSHQPSHSVNQGDNDENEGGADGECDELNADSQPSSGAVLFEFASYTVNIRASRLFDSLALYKFLLVMNCGLRFIWTLTLIPSSYLTPLYSAMNAGLAVSPDTWRYSLTPILSLLEIFRRLSWAVLRVENEALRQTRGSSPTSLSPSKFEELEMTKMPMSGTQTDASFSPVAPITMQSLSLKDWPSSFVLMELTMYSVIFMSVAVLAAT